MTGIAPRKARSMSKEAIGRKSVCAGTVFTPADDHLSVDRVRGPEGLRASAQIGHHVWVGELITAAQEENVFAGRRSRANIECIVDSAVGAGQQSHGHTG